MQSTPLIRRPSFLLLMALILGIAACDVDVQVDPPLVIDRTLVQYDIVIVPAPNPTPFTPSQSSQPYHGPFQEEPWQPSYNEAGWPVHNPNQPAVWFPDTPELLEPIILEPDAPDWVTPELLRSLPHPNPRGHEIIVL